MVKGPYSIKDWSYLSDTVVGDGFILVGDAACFVDPLFSSGVHLALSAGILAAAYVTTALKDPELAVAAGPVYQELYYSHYDRFHEMAKLFYSSNRTVESYFWEARRILGDGDGTYTPRQDFIRAVAGQPPQGYERVVLAQGTTAEGTAQRHPAGRRRPGRRGGPGSIEAPGGWPGPCPGWPPTPRCAQAGARRRRVRLGRRARVGRRPEGVACSPLVVELLRSHRRAAIGFSVNRIRKRWSGFDAFARRAPYASAVLMLLVAAYMAASGWIGLGQARLLS